MPKIKSSIKEYSLEEKITELEKIETLFQNPAIGLDAAIKEHENALGIAKEIMTYLDKAENTLKTLDIAKMLSQDDVQ